MQAFDEKRQLCKYLLDTLEKASTFKGKCVVNAENFKCNLQTGPLTNMLFEGRQTMLKARAFQHCIATGGLAFMRQSL